MRCATANTQGVMTWAAAGSTARQIPNCMTTHSTGPKSAPPATISERGPGSHQAAYAISEPNSSDISTCTIRPMNTAARSNLGPSGADRQKVLVMRFSSVQNPAPVSHKMNISQTDIITPPRIPPMAAAPRVALVMAVPPVHALQCARPAAGGRRAGHANKEAVYLLAKTNIGGPSAQPLR